MMTWNLFAHRMIRCPGSPGGKPATTAIGWLLLGVIGVAVGACEGTSPAVHESSIDPHLAFAQFLTSGIPHDGGVVIAATHPDEMGIEYRGSMLVPGTDMLAYRGPLIPSEYRFARFLLEGMPTEDGSVMVLIRDPERMDEELPPEMEITGAFPVKGGMVYRGVVPSPESPVDSVSASGGSICYVTDYKNIPGNDEFGVTGPKTPRAREYMDYVNCVKDLLALIRDEASCVVTQAPVWNPDTEVYDLEATIVCSTLF